MEVTSNFKNKEVDVDFYRVSHLDLQHLTDEQLVEHYFEYGKKEGRKPNNVDVDFYRVSHLDLQHLTDEQLVEHYIEYGKKEGRLHLINYELKNLDGDILIIAAHPINLSYLNIIHNISKYFKKTYFVHSVKNWIVDLNHPTFDNINIEIIYTENVGYDFKKYLIGMSRIKNNGESFNRLWLSNDSYIVTDWEKSLLIPRNLYKIYKNDMVGTFFEYADEDGILKQHIPSFLLILNKEIAEFYYEQLINNDYMNIEITTEEIKLKYISKIEVGLCYELIKSNKYKIDTLYGYKTPVEIANIIRTTYTIDVHELLYSPYFMKTKHKQSWGCGPINNIFKTKYTCTQNFAATSFFNWNLSNNRFEENLNIFFHLYQPFARYYNYFYNKKIVLNYCNYYLNVDKCVLYPTLVTKLPNFININIGDNTLYNMNTIGNHFKLWIENDDIYKCANLVNYIKKYNGDNSFINFLKNRYFFIKKGYTSINELVDSVRDIQKNTQNKKLVYTNNLNSYDTFWDICDNYLENDTDYIYISDIYDKNVCNNFKHIYCNLDSNDDFYKNRIIKFNKQIFDCYDKVLYIDANVKIQCKLSELFDMLDAETDLVLFSHPERSNVGQEIYEVYNDAHGKSKWNVINDTIFSEFQTNYSPFMNNKLYWLNTHLSNTKYNIYTYINNIYEKYKFKRDQIYFSIIQNNYNIKTINIFAETRPNNINDPNMIMYDGDYGYINGWTTYFTRPFGGSHL